MKKHIRKNPECRRKARAIYEDNIRAVKRQCKKGTEFYKFMMSLCEEYKNKGTMIVYNEKPD